MIPILLTPDEQTFVIQVGDARCAMQLSHGRDCYNGIPPQRKHRRGALGECVTHKAFGLPWDGMYYAEEEWQKWRYEGRDVGPLEVRATMHPRGRLAFYDEDADDRPYVHVIISPRPTVTPCFVVGWAFGSEGKIAEYLMPGFVRRTYLLPNARLRSTASLEVIVRRWVDQRSESTNAGDGAAVGI